MNLYDAIEKALEKGEQLKEQLLVELMNSQAINELLQNELFIKSLTKVLNTKYEVSRALKTNLRSVLKTLSVPNQEEVHTLKRKIDRLENEIGEMQKKVVAKNLQKKAKKVSAKKPSKKKVTKRKKATAKKKKAAKRR